MQRKSVAELLLTIGLVIVFVYFGIDKLVHPDLWIGWIPLWMEGLLGLPRESWLFVIGIVETILGLLLLLPFRSIRKIATVLIALHLIAILTQTGLNDIAARDFGLLMGALALLALI